VITADEAPRGGRKTALKIEHRQAALLNVLHDVKVPGGQAHRRQTTWIDGRDSITTTCG
jgi:acetyl-CoA synthetase